MFQTSAYGQTYLGGIGAATGTAIYNAQRESVQFARAVERQRLMLQRRQLDQQEAAMEAKRRESDRNYDLAQARFELERKRLDNDFAIRQQEREAVSRKYDQAMQDQKYQREIDAANAERKAAFEQARLDNETRRLDLEERRIERQEQQQQEQASTAQAATRRASANTALVKGVKELAKSLRGEDDGSNLLKHWMEVADPEGTDTDFRNAVDRLVAEGTAKGKTDYSKAISEAVKKAHRTKGVNADAERGRFKERVDRSRQAADVLDTYAIAAQEDPALLDAIKPSMLKTIKWSRMTKQALDKFMEYLEYGDFSNEEANIAMRTMLRKASEDQEREFAKAREKESEDRAASAGRLYREMKEREKRADSNDSEQRGDTEGPKPSLLYMYHP